MSIDAGLPETNIELYQYALEPLIVFVLKDQDDDPIDPSGMTLRLIVHTVNAERVIATLATGGSGIATSVDSDGNYIATCTPSAASTAQAGRFRYELRMLGTGVNVPLYRGSWGVTASPQAWSV